VGRASKKNGQRQKTFMVSLELISFFGSNNCNAVIWILRYTKKRCTEQVKQCDDFFSGTTLSMSLSRNCTLCFSHPCL